MTVPQQTPVVSYTSNGLTAGPFAFPFRIIDADDLKVLVSGSLASPSTYTISGIGNDEGSVTFSTIPAVGAQIILYRQVALERDNDYQFNGDLLAVTVNADFDRIWMALQDIGDTTTRAIHYPVEEFGVDGTLPGATVRAGNVLGFDANGAQTILPIPALVGAGDLRTDVFISSLLPNPGGLPTFIAGTTTLLTLSRAPISIDNTTVHFDAGYQGKDQIQGISGTQLSLVSAIPVGTERVYVTTGTTLSLSSPALASARPEALVPGSGGFYSDFSPAPIVWKFADRVRMGTSQALNADLAWTASPVFTTPYGWQERDSTVFVTSAGRLAISGVVQTSKNIGPFAGAGFNPTAIGVNGLAFNDDIAHNSLAWGGYFEAYRVQGAGAIYAMELDVGEGSSASTINDPYTIGGSASVGILLNSGGSTGRTYAGPSSAALIIGNNGNTFRRGIVFNSDAITAFPGQDPAAISMARGHAINWFNAAGNVSSTIRSDVSAAGQNKHLIFTDLTVVLGNNGVADPFIFNIGGAPANGLRFDATSTGSGFSQITAIGTDANLDLALAPQGNGVLKFGTFTSTGGIAQTGYITIKDGGGTVRRLLVG